MILFFPVKTMVTAQPLDGNGYIGYILAGMSFKMLTYTAYAVLFQEFFAPNLANSDRLCCF